MKFSGCTRLAVLVNHISLSQDWLITIVVITHIDHVPNQVTDLAKTEYKGKMDNKREVTPQNIQIRAICHIVHPFPVP